MDKWVWLAEAMDVDGASDRLKVGVVTVERTDFDIEPTIGQVDAPPPTLFLSNGADVRVDDYEPTQLETVAGTPAQNIAKKSLAPISFNSIFISRHVYVNGSCFVKCLPLPTSLMSSFRVPHCRPLQQAIQSTDFAHDAFASSDAYVNGSDNTVKLMDSHRSYLSRLVLTSIVFNLHV